MLFTQATICLATLLEPLPSYNHCPQYARHCQTVVSLPRRARKVLVMDHCNSEFFHCSLCIVCDPAEFDRMDASIANQWEPSASSNTIRPAKSVQHNSIKWIRLQSRFSATILWDSREAWASLRMKLKALAMVEKNCMLKNVQKWIWTCIDKMWHSPHCTTARLKGKMLQG